MPIPPAVIMRLHRAWLATGYFGVPGFVRFGALRIWLPYEMPPGPRDKKLARAVNVPTTVGCPIQRCLYSVTNLACRFALSFSLPIVVVVPMGGTFCFRKRDDIYHRYLCQCGGIISRLVFYRNPPVILNLSFYFLIVVILLVLTDFVFKEEGKPQRHKEHKGVRVVREQVVS
jgi:hypothetical protein